MRKNDKDSKTLPVFGFRKERVISKLEPQKGLINISEPQVIKINQFWKTISENK